MITSAEHAALAQLVKLFQDRPGAATTQHPDGATRMPPTYRMLTMWNYSILRDAEVIKDTYFLANDRQRW